MRNQWLAGRMMTLAFVVSLSVVACGQSPPASGGQTAATAPDTRQANQAVVQRFYDEVFNKHNLAAADNIFDANFAVHDLDVGGEQPGGDLPGTIDGFPDVKATINQWAIDGDLVTAMVTYNGTHKGTFMGVAPTGKTVTWSLIDLWRVKDGKITELWHNVPNDDILEQIGATPAVVPATAPITDPLAVVQAFYDLVNAKHYDAAQAFLADDAAIVTPDGRFTGKEAVVKRLADDGVSFELTNLKATSGRVTYSYKVLIGGTVVGSGDDGVNIVRDGKIVFAGIESNAPK